MKNPVQIYLRTEISTEPLYFTFRTADCKFSLYMVSRLSLSTATLKSGLAYFPMSYLTVSRRDRNASSSTLWMQDHVPGLCVTGCALAALHLIELVAAVRRAMLVSVMGVHVELVAEEAFSVGRGSRGTRGGGGGGECGRGSGGGATSNRKGDGE
jgi:hypothetical protein